MASSSSSALMASSSHSAMYTGEWEYDVFLCFRGDDTRHGFASHLMAALSDKQIKAFIDTMLRKTECIDDPELHLVQGRTLKEKTEFIRWMDWGMSTDFQKVFDKILDAAVLNNLTEDQLIKRVFVFSDMEFNEASIPRWVRDPSSKWRWLEVEPEQRSWETDYQAIQRKFREKGYNRVPEIVFWNLRDSQATPVAGTQNGVALVSGFSKNFLKMFMEGGGIVNPEEVMRLAIAGKAYEKLAVYD